MQVVKPRNARRRALPWIARGAGLCLGLAAAIGAAWLAAPRLARAYVPPLDELVDRLVAGAPTASSAILELRCRVYPYPPPANAAPGTQPAPEPARSFRQRIYWQRGRLLAVETLADDGTLLHVLLEEAGLRQTAQVSPARKFTLADVRPLLYPFLEGSAAEWMDELQAWGIAPRDVDLALTKTGQMYRLADDADRALWVDKESNRPTRLATRVEGGGTPWQLAIEFGDFVSFAARGPEKDNPRIPRRFTYSLNGSVFKEVQVTDYEVEPNARKFPLARLRQLVAAAQDNSGKPQ